MITKEKSITWLDNHLEFEEVLTQTSLELREIVFKGPSGRRPDYISLEDASKLKQLKRRLIDLKDAGERFRKRYPDYDEWFMWKLDLIDKFLNQVLIEGKGS